MADTGQDVDGQEPPDWFMDQLDTLIERHHASYQEWLSRRERQATAPSRTLPVHPEPGMTGPTLPETEA